MERKQLNKNTMVFRTTYDAKSRNLKILALTDVHFDSPYCDRKMFKKHLDKALEDNAQIFFNGDLFDVMGCYKDPRSKAADIRPEYIKQDSSYLDLIINDAYEFLLPYKDNILFMGYGNHETSILKHRDTDPLKRLIYLLNSKGANILSSLYFGYAVFEFINKGGGGMRKFVLFHHHGYGGSAKRSKGVLNVDLDSQNYPFADIIFSGHTHQKWYVPEKSHHMKRTYEVVMKTQYHVKGGSYKDTSGKAMGWEVEKGFNPTPIGGWWFDLSLSGKQSSNRVIDIIEAK